MAAGQLRIAPVAGRAEAREFIELPYRLYADHPTWVPPLRAEEKKLMDQRKNPFFRHATVQHFLAWRDSQVVGRIAAIENTRHNEVHGDTLGFFGLFECEADPGAVRGLLDAAQAWCNARKLTPMRGPVNYSTNDPCGVLVEGFEHPPMLLTPWNRPDYDELLVGAGLMGVKDLLALWIPSTGSVPERFERVVTKRLARTGTTLRRLDLGNFAQEVKHLKELYNRCWELNWGFVPATDEEFDHAASDLKMIACPDLSAIAERDGKPIGFSVFLKDLNEILPPLRGRLLPFGWLHLLRKMKRIQGRRCVLLGVVPEARGGAVNEAMFIHAIRTCAELDLPGAEASWVLADNDRMIAPIQAVGGTVTKRWRMYETPT